MINSNSPAAIPNDTDQNPVLQVIEGQVEMLPMTANSMGVLVMPINGVTPAFGILGNVSDTTPIPFDTVYPSFVPIDPSQGNYYLTSTMTAPINLLEI